MARNETVPNSVAKLVKGKEYSRYEKIVNGKDGKDSDGKDLKDSKISSVWKATRELLLKEIGDKTFVLVFIFTLGWSNPDGKFNHNLDGREK